MGIWMADVGDAGYLVDSAVALGLE
jgi:hypothetical protein